MARLVAVCEAALAAGVDALRRKPWAILAMPCKPSPRRRFSVVRDFAAGVGRKLHEDPHPNFGTPGKAGIETGNDFGD